MIFTALSGLLALIGIVISSYSLLIGESVQWWEIVTIILSSFLLGSVCALWRDAWHQYKQGG